MKKLLYTLALLFMVSIPALCPIVLSAAPPATGLAEDIYRFSVDAASITIAMPDGWDVITQDPAVGKPIVEKYGGDWNDILASMKSQNIYISAINPSTQAQIQVYLNERGTGTPASNFYRISQQEADEISKQYLQSGLPMTVAKAGGYYYICIVHADSSGQITHIEYQTRVSSTYVSIKLFAAQNSVLSDGDKAVLKQVLQNVSFNENVLLEMAQGYGYILAAALWLAFAIFALVRLVNRKKPLPLRQAQYDRLGRTGGAPLVAAIRAVLGIVAVIYFFILNKPHGLFLVLYVVMCLLLLAAPLALLPLRSRAFIWIYTAGIIFTDFMNIAFLTNWGILLFFSIDPIILISLLASKRTAVLFNSRQIQITDAAETPAQPGSP